MMGFVVQNDNVLLAVQFRQTRRTIWSEVSVNGFGRPSERIDFVILPTASFSRNKKHDNW